MNNWQQWMGKMDGRAVAAPLIIVLLLAGQMPGLWF